MLKMHFGWKDLGLAWRSEDIYRVLEVLKEKRIPARMPSDDMFLYSPYFPPHPDRRWQILIRRKDWRRAVDLLAREGLASAATVAAAQKRPDPDRPLIRWESGEWIIYIGRTRSLPPSYSAR